jgi:endonuclease III
MAQASAEESILQMATRPALTALKDFIANPTTHRASALIEIPTLYDLIRHEYGLHKEYSDTLISVCKWICERGQSVLEELMVHHSPPIPAEMQSEGAWSKVHPQLEVFPCA